MLVACAHSLCLPLEPHGYTMTMTMTKAECEARAAETRLIKPMPVGCLDEHDWIFVINNAMLPQPDLLRIAH